MEPLYSSRWASIFSAVFVVRCCLSQPEKKYYHGYKIINTQVTDEGQRWLIHDLNHNGKIRLLSPTTYLMRSPSQSKSITALVPPENWTYLRALWKARGIVYEVVVEDFQQYIDSSVGGPRHKKRRRQGRSVQPGKRSSLGKYHTNTEVNALMKIMEKENPGLVKVIRYGRSSEGRELLAVHIDDKPQEPPKGQPPKRVIVVDAGIHAREWITVSSALCIIAHLLGNHASDSFLRRFHWIIVPVANVDGYEYSWNFDRLWRKTRSKLLPEQAGHMPVHADCIGVDPNRNWETHWGEKGVQRYNTCTEVYAGPRPFSEPEVAALSDVLEYYRERISLHVSLHAFSQVILSPFGYRSGKTRQYRRQAAVMKAGVDAIKSASGNSYNYGSIYEAMYAASGSSIDYVYEALGVNHTYVIELRDTGKYGFVLPEDEILPTCRESVAAVMAMAREAVRVG